MQFDRLKRREFVALLGGAASWPLTARTQQAAMPLVGLLYNGDPDADADLAASFRNGLAETGFIEGRNVAIEYRWSRNDIAQLPDLIDDLVRRRVAVIAVTGNPTLRAAVAVVVGQSARAAADAQCSGHK
jgi:putative tryptophan/tyrosine transport system substrate-binding protein